MDYFKQINQAIEYIEANLEGELIVDKISKEAGISKWHFQRVFKALTGETVKSYILSRKLSLAARDLLETDLKIADIAFERNFNSHETFARAFQRAFKVAPGKYREINRGKLKVYPRAGITIEYLNHLEKGLSMQPRLIELEELVVTGLKTKINSVKEEGFENNLKTVPELWKKLTLTAPVLCDRQAQKASLIYSENENDLNEDLLYLAGVVNREGAPNEGLIDMKVASGTFAEFIHKGPAKDIGHTMNYIYGVWFPKTGAKRRKAPDVNFYEGKGGPESSDWRIRILIPIEKPDNF